MSKRILKSRKVLKKASSPVVYNNPMKFYYSFSEDDTSTFLLAITPAEGCNKITDGADVMVIGSATTWGTSVASHFSTQVEGLTTE